MRIVYKIMISQTSIGTLVSSVALSFNATSLITIIALTVTFEFLETLIGLGLGKLYRKIKVRCGK